MGEVVRFPVERRSTTTDKILAESTRRVMQAFNAHDSNLKTINAHLRREINREREGLGRQSSPAWRT